MHRQTRRSRIECGLIVYDTTIRKRAGFRPSRDCLFGFSPRALIINYYYWESQLFNGTKLAVTRRLDQKSWLKTVSTILQKTLSHTLDHQLFNVDDVTL